MQDLDTIAGELERWLESALEGGVPPEFICEAIITFALVKPLMAAGLQDIRPEKTIEGNERYVAYDLAGSNGGKHIFEVKFFRHHTREREIRRDLNRLKGAIGPSSAGYLIVVLDNGDRVGEGNILRPLIERLCLENKLEASEKRSAFKESGRYRIFIGEVTQPKVDSMVRSPC